MHGYRASRWISRSVASILALAVPAGATQPVEVFLEQAELKSFDTREARATEQQRAAEAQGALGRLLPALSARGVYTRNQTESSIVVPGTQNQVVITPLELMLS